MRAFRLLLVVLMGSAVAHALDLPDLSSAHRFWDRPNQVLLLTHVALEGEISPLRIATSAGEGGS